MAHPIPSAKTALKAMLVARPAWSGVDIRDGQPTETEDVTRSAFWFQPTRIPSDAWASLGAQRRRVTFLLAFTVAIIQEGDDERATEDQLWALLEDLMLAVKANASLGGVIQQADDLVGDQHNEPIAPALWRAVFTGSLACLSKPY